MRLCLCTVHRHIINQSSELFCNKNKPTISFGLPIWNGYFGAWFFRGHCYRAGVHVCSLVLVCVCVCVCVYICLRKSGSHFVYGWGFARHHFRRRGLLSCFLQSVLTFQQKTVVVFSLVRCCWKYYSPCNAAGLVMCSRDLLTEVGGRLC